MRGESQIVRLDGVTLRPCAAGAVGLDTEAPA